jgi:gamma-glutamylcyclotransferase (GGCT)/AIG2-like uncharacterized protein YtfP
VAAPAGSRRVTLPRLFVYGTLQNDTVVQELLGHRLFGRPAVLKGYARSVDPTVGYPVIRSQEGGVVPGTLLDGVDGRSLAILDEYEGPQYRRIVVHVHTVEGRALDAYVYVPA